MPSIAGLCLCAITDSLYALLVNTQFSDQAEIKDTSHLTNKISNLLQKLPRCFHGTTISTSFFSTSSSSSFSLIFVL